MVVVITQLLIAFLFCLPTLGSESIGELSLRRFLLEPQIHTTEPKSGGLSFQRYLLELQWQSLHDVSAHFVMGDSMLRPQPRWYGDSVSAEDFTLLEAYLEWNAPVGEVRFGLIPIYFGLESGSQEYHLILPRSLLYQERFLLLRDFGASYWLTHQDYFTSIILSHGESAPDQDNQYWLTCQWGWGYTRPFQIALSGSVGRTTTDSTNPKGITSTSPLYNISEDGKIRIGGLHLMQNDPSWQSQLEIYIGETLQESGMHRFGGGHFDLSISLGESLSLISRYDKLYLSENEQNYREEISAGISFHNIFGTSILTLLGKKRSDATLGEPLHEGFLIWRASSEIFSPKPK